MIETIDIPDEDYNLTQITIKEIIDKYPDKVMDVINRKKEVIIVLDTCKIIMRKK
jgi:hypothetical protein|tara:strand:+ start:202 stop:366 length:165 start_codon:yes stop_codon:yes gene_type:complete